MSPPPPPHMIYKMSSTFMNILNTITLCKIKKYFDEHKTWKDDDDDDDDDDIMMMMIMMMNNYSS